MDPDHVEYVLAIRAARREAWLLRWAFREWLDWFFNLHSRRTVQFETPSVFG